jgi:hypothetical protein
MVIASTLLISAAYAHSPAASVGPSAASASAIPVVAKSAAAPGTDVEKHIRVLHTKLAITAAEEPQWAQVAQTMRDSATELDKAIDKRQAIVASATAPDNLNAYGDIAQAHADGVKKLAAAFSTLYESMPDDQKKIADDVFAQRAHGGR